MENQIVTQDSSTKKSFLFILLSLLILFLIRIIGATIVSTICSTENIDECSFNSALVASGLYFIITIFLALSVANVFKSWLMSGEKSLGTLSKVLVLSIFILTIYISLFWISEIIQTTANIFEGKGFPEPVSEKLLLQ